MYTQENFHSISKLFESTNSLVFRAREEQSGRAVILKCLKDERPSPARLARYQQEFDITRGLDLPEVINVYSLLRDRKSLVMVVEDFGGESLARLVHERSFSLLEVLDLGARIAETLAKIHERHIIHKDLNPSNIIYAHETDTLKLIDFGISTRLRHQTSDFVNPKSLEGTLAYVSPEQTGRMNRHLDYRTDFYSLGVTLYELACGVRPFTQDDPLQLIHSHLARHPRPPHEVNKEIPEALSKLLMKLLAKNADERYANGWSIANDLRACTGLLTSGSLPESFEFSAHEAPTRFELPQKLYGREVETRRLLEFYGRASRGTPSFVLVAGYSGSGKTSLVQELYRPVSLTRGHYCAGKFDQLRGIPFAAFGQAFSRLIARLLAEGEDELARWRQRLQNTLRADAQVLVDFLPGLATVIGPQAPVHELGALESNRRMRRLLLAFLGLFCNAESPLVLFLDDLQWADSLTLELIDHLIRKAQLPHLLVVGAYRNNEVGALHPLTKMCESLRDDGHDIHEFVLSDLAEHDIVTLLSDTLYMPESEVTTLAGLIKVKTGGNPFFVRQWLTSLYNDGLLYIADRDPSGRAVWAWQQDKIAELGFADNVVDLMLTKLRRLPEQAREALQLAAYLGDHFDLDSLSVIAGIEVDAMSMILQPAAEAGFVLPTSEMVAVEGQDASLSVIHLKYRFLHDRVQQAAYALAPEADRAKTHTKIGQLLLRSLGEEARTQRLFEIVDHLNRGTPPADDEQQLVNAKLNLLAARRAKIATAFAAGRDYIIKASEITGELAVKSDHNLVMDILSLRVELESITANYETAETIGARALELAQSVVETARIQRILISQRTMLSQHEEAISAGLETLLHLGISFPSEALGDLLLADHAKIMAVVKTNGLDFVLELEPCQTPEHELSLILLSSLIGVCYQSRPELMPVICTRIILLSFDYGLHLEAVLGFAAYAILLGAQFQEHQLGYEMGQIAFGIAKLFNNNRTQLCRATSVAVGHLNHWVKPFADNEDIANRGFQAGVEVGEQEYASYILGHNGTNWLVAGQRLDDLHERLVKYSEHIEATQNEISLLQMMAARLVVDDLRNADNSAEALETQRKAEQDFLERAESSQSILPIAQFEITKARTLYCLGQYDEAYALLLSAEQKLPYIAGLSTVADYHFYLALTIMTRALKRGAPLNKEDQQRLEAVLTYTEHLAKNCPENFAHKHALLQAESARLEGCPWKAIQAYDRAIGLAANNHAGDEAVAHARASAFWAAQGNIRVSELYLRESYQCFRDWGARRVMFALEREHPRILARNSVAGGISTSVSTTSTASDGLNRALDLDTVIRASRSIASSRELDVLLRTIMKISLESAGADRGFLLLEQDGAFIAKARGHWEERAEIELMSSALDSLDDELSTQIVHYVARTGEPIILDNASHNEAFIADPYIRNVGACSVLCLPLLNQGSVVALLFMENRAITAAFTQDTLAVLALLMTPAALALENAVLKHSIDDSSFAFQVGGSLAPDSLSYVTRQADRELERGLRNGDFCYVLCPRQMGKSSLRVHAMRRLRNTGNCCVAIDLSMIGSHTVNADQWYAGIARALIGGLGLSREIVLRRWWRDHDHLSAVQRVSELLDTLLELVEGELVIFIDEVDSVLSLKFSPDDFFTMLRGLFNRRADDARYRRLSVVVLGVATPNDLVRDPSRTAFNLGRSIHLDCFKTPECAPLLAGLASKSEDPQAILHAVLSWTGGQPFLTQRICQLLRELPTQPRPGQEDRWVGQTVRSQVIERWEQRDEPVHLRPIEERLVGSPRVQELLARYSEVLQHSGELTALGDALENELLLTGLILRVGDTLHVGCRVYREVFDTQWIAATATKTTTSKQTTGVNDE